MLGMVKCVGVTKNTLVEVKISQNRKPVGCITWSKGTISENIQVDRKTETVNSMLILVEKPGRGRRSSSRLREPTHPDADRGPGSDPELCIPNNSAKISNSN